MVQFNFSERIIKAKVVYYGPAQSGKTTNLEQIHALTDPKGHNRLVSLNTAQDRTLFFDLLPFNLGKVAGYDFKIQLYTVPGQVQYNATRRVVLAGADAVVFVADSRRSLVKENVAAFENMKVNLLANRLVPEKVPLVLQFNKQDLPDLMNPDELNGALNLWRRPAFPAVAASGDGVMETFIAVTKQMLAGIAVKYDLKEKGLDPDSIPEVVDASFAILLNDAKEHAGAAPGTTRAAPRVILSSGQTTDQAASLQASSEAGLVSEELLHRSIRTNVELAETLSELVREMSEGLERVDSQAALLLMLSDDAATDRRAPAATIQTEVARLRKIVQQLGSATTAPPAVAQNTAPPVPTPRPPPAPGPTTAQPPATTGTLDQAVGEAVARVRAHLDGRGMRIELSVPQAPLPPRVLAAKVSQAMGALLQGLATTCSQGSVVRVRAERKPVLLRGRDGSEVKRDFLMLASAHEGVLTPEQQQNAARGVDPGPFGVACRTIKESGGFVRFAPLSGGGLETRFFLPAT